MSGFRRTSSALFWIMILLSPAAHAQQAPNETTEINLRKSVVVREFAGKPVSGEERQIGRGDSLWRILVQEKGLPERSFRSYLVVIRGLNPEIRNLDVLRVGDKIFIPLRLSDAAVGSPIAEAELAAPAQAAAEQTVEYRVGVGEFLYAIIRERFKLTDERKIAQYVALVKDLNPHRKRAWDSLQEGEIIRLPVVESGSGADKSSAGQLAASAATGRPALGASRPGSDLTGSADPERVLRLPARENMPVLVKVVHATGNQIQQSGEEVIALADERVRFDRSNYPVIYNAALRQKLVVDQDGKIPPSLKANLNDPGIGTPVLSMGDGVTVADAVRQMLTGFGYQTLPRERPVIVQQSGIAFEAKGHWMALAPATNNTRQELVVISLSETANSIPEYLTAELGKQGLHLRNVALSSPQTSSAAPTVPPARASLATVAKQWPSEKTELIDAVLTALSVPFKSGQMFAVELGAGLSVDTRVDRMIQTEGKPAAIFFRRGDPEIFRALQERHGIDAIGLDLAALSSRELISRVLELTGERSMYSEHRFPLTQGSAVATVALKAWGFQLAKKGMFVTDRQIPLALHQFFFEKGLDIIYFR